MCDDGLVDTVNAGGSLTFLYQATLGLAEGLDDLNR
jgi:hypothetical protein